jgi:hypothetical protein
LTPIWGVPHCPFHLTTSILHHLRSPSFPLHLRLACPCSARTCEFGSTVADVPLAGERRRAYYPLYFFSLTFYFCSLLFYSFWSTLDLLTRALRGLVGPIIILLVGWRLGLLPTPGRTSPPIAEDHSRDVVPVHIQRDRWLPGSCGSVPRLARGTTWKRSSWDSRNRRTVPSGLCRSAPRLVRGVDAEKIPVECRGDPLSWNSLLTDLTSQCLPIAEVDLGCVGPVLPWWASRP